MSYDNTPKAAANLTEESLLKSLQTIKDYVSASGKKISLKPTQFLPPKART